jgi:hypothetical protein
VSVRSSLATFFNLKRADDRLSKGLSDPFTVERILGYVTLTLFLVSLVNILIR